jgi:hypothetical protein
MAGSMTIFCDARRIDFGISGEGRQRIVARDNDTDVGDPFRLPLSDAGLGRRGRGTLCVADH